MESIENLFRRLEQLNEIGAALSSERNIERLLENILLAAKTVTHADGGTLYRLTEDRHALHCEIVHNDTLGMVLGGTSGRPIDYPDLPLTTAQGEPNNARVAVNATREGPLADFTMSAADLHELKIAGLLHDCGKVTTPVHVVDKATKLQTIYDRIGLIDTRSEVLKRDVQLATLRKLLELRAREQPEAEAACWDDCRSELKLLDEQQAFLRRVNVGCEAMSAADQQRVRDIGSGRTWRNPAGVDADFLTAEEIENLTIRSGTLTAAERETINHHIVATIRMLEALPWPKHLRHVPEYAGGHHERMDGTGYPKGLTREQMSPQARMMGIADIFEALTARDRPYKPGMKLSQAIAIPRKFARNGHIDPDLFDVFMRQGAFRRYADVFLDPEQIDVVPDL